MVFGRSKKEVFFFIVDQVWKKLKGWKEKTLAGIEVLIKSEAREIPIYIMSCYELSDSCGDQIERMIGKFWWGAKEGQRKIH